MDDTDKSSGTDPMAKHHHVDTSKTLEQLEKDHGTQKSPQKLAADAFKDDDEGFKTPEEVAQAEDKVEGDDPQVKSKKQGFWSKFSHKNLTKKQKIILIIVLIVALFGLLVGAWMWKNKKMPISMNKPAQKKEAAKPTTVPSTLTGRPVSPDVNERQVTAVMIENSPDARPQSGLIDAGVVFEAVAEGGVTRFVALFQDTAPDYVGPIRSARSYYIDWMRGFDAAYAHVGGSPEALAIIKGDSSIKDLDQFSNSGSYDRVTSRYAPHNVYTSIGRLNGLEASKGYTKSTFTGFVRKKDAPSPAPNQNKIDINMSGFLYNPHWDYDKTTNTYIRSEGGKPHTDEKTGQPIRANVIVALETQKGIMADGYHSTYTTIGSGKVMVFQDGAMVGGTWSKKDAKSQIVFTGDDGKPLALNTGITWITAVGGAQDVTAGP